MADVQLAAPTTSLWCGHSRGHVVIVILTHEPLDVNSRSVLP